MRARAVEGSGALVAFTLCGQAAAGIAASIAFLPGTYASGRSYVYALVLLCVGSLAALGHLSRPARGRLVAANLASSWLSREALVGALFGLALLCSAVSGRPHAHIATALVGFVFVLSIAAVYRLRTVPAWDTWVTPLTFVCTAVVLGALHYLWADTLPRRAPLIHVAAYVAAAAQTFSIAATWTLLRRLGREGGATHGRPRLDVGQRGVLALRIASAGLGSALLLLGAGWSGPALMILSEILGRHLFYALHRRVGL